MDGLPDNLRKFLSDHFDMPEPRLEKCKTMYALAREAVRGGVIVELGAYHGSGTISLCYGSRDGSKTAVHTVDHYTDFTGWAQEKYSRHDLDIFIENIAQAGVKPYIHIGEFDSVGMGWKEPISLLVWDGGYIDPNLKDTIDIYMRHLVKGGTLAIRETINAEIFGARETCMSYTLEGKFTIPERFPGGFFVTRKLG